MNWCLIIPLIVGVICAILGYLLGRLSSGNNNAEIDAWKKKYAKLEADLVDCRSKLSTQPAIAVIPFDAGLAKSVFGKAIKQDDLKIIEGIGPKIEKLFQKHGIVTWKALAECSVEKCQEILDSGGKAFEIHRPGTWPKQAQLAYEGKWAELLKWQDELKGGK
ncbi:hypothetical protein [Galbibacter sp. PAP.153]|uniref:hypothetical protein n=1 Tax=Galbibacter sp. PAP.153 TaxID=3104623 RepID=UPI0030084A34